MKQANRFRKLRFESLEQRALLATFHVSNNNSSGAGSLRDAIVQANNFTDGDVISFDQLPSNQRVITLASPLPTIVAPVDIGFGTPLVQIKPGSGFGSTGYGLQYGSGQSGALSHVYNLSVTGFPQGGILVDGNSTVQVIGCFVGVAPDGSQAGNGGFGIEFTTTTNSTNNQVQSSLISSNTGYGIAVISTAGVQIFQNSIGTNAAGTTDYGNGFGGIDAEAVSSINISGNLIAGNDGDGIHLLNVSGTGAVITNNDIGVDASFNAALPNLNNGIDIAATTSISGSILVDVENNVIAGNASGIRLSGNDAPRGAHRAQQYRRRRQRHVTSR